MNSNIRKYISCLLLFVFSYTILPASLFHSLFAHHTDTVDNYCDYYHKNAGTHIEEQQTHCDAFKANTPLYDAVKVTPQFEAFLIVISVCKESKVSPYTFETPLNLSSRVRPLVNPVSGKLM